MGTTGATHGPRPAIGSRSPRTSVAPPLSMEVGVVDVATGSVTLLTEGERGATLHAIGFSPRGDRILFSSSLGNASRRSSRRCGASASTAPTRASSSTGRGRGSGCRDDRAARSRHDALRTLLADDPLRPDQSSDQAGAAVVLPGREGMSHDMVTTCSVVETISGRCNHHGHRVRVRRVHHEPPGTLGASHVGPSDLGASHRGARDRGLDGRALPVRAVRGRAAGGDRGDGTGRLVRLSQLGHGRAQARPRGRADRDRDLVLHREWPVQRPVPLGRAGHRGRGRRRRGGRSDRRRPGGRAPRQHLLHVITARRR